MRSEQETPDRASEPPGHPPHPEPPEPPGHSGHPGRPSYLECPEPPGHTKHPGHPGHGHSHDDGTPRISWTGGPYSAWRKVFPGLVASVPKVRSWARDLLAGRVAAPVLDDVLLLLSELATNAVTHSDSGHAEDGHLSVHLARTTTMVHVEVTDGGSVTNAPAVRVPEADDDGGRGLWLVDLLATEWGFHHDGPGRSVWFQIAVIEAPADKTKIRSARRTG